MKREIKFKGKRLDNGEWVYGYPQHNECLDGWYIFPPQGTKGLMVVTDTIGQFTGFKDKNGKEIYEGDTILIHDSGHCTKHVIEWRSGCFWCINTGRGYNCQLGDSIVDYSYQLCMEVIGNIHDDK